MNSNVPQYTRIDSVQSLQEGIDEYYACNAFLLDPTGLPPEVSTLFRQHDAGHVLFGCDTSLRGETLIDTWTILGTTAGLRGYLQYFRYPQVNQIFKAVGPWVIFVESLKCSPDVARVFWRSYRMNCRWPWSEYELYLDRPLCDLRQQFNIRIV